MTHARPASTSLTAAITSPPRSHHGRSAATANAGPDVVGCVAVQRGNATTVGCVVGAAAQTVIATTITFRAATIRKRRAAMPSRTKRMGRSLRHAHPKFNRRPHLPPAPDNHAHPPRSLNLQQPPPANRLFLYAGNG